MKALKTAMLSKLQEHQLHGYGFIKRTLQEKTTILDPRFKALNYFSESAWEKIKKSVREEAILIDTALHEVEAPVDDSGLEPPTKK